MATGSANVPAQSRPHLRAGTDGRNRGLIWFEEHAWRAHPSNVHRSALRGAHCRKFAPRGEHRQVRAGPIGHPWNGVGRDALTVSALAAPGRAPQVRRGSSAPVMVNVAAAVGSAGRIAPARLWSRHEWGGPPGEAHDRARAPVEQTLPEQLPDRERVSVGLGQPPAHMSPKPRFVATSPRTWRRRRHIPPSMSVKSGDTSLAPRARGPLPVAGVTQGGRSRPGA